MKNSILYPLSILFLTLTTFSGCQSSSNKVENAEYDKKLLELENKNSDLKKKLADLKDDGQNNLISFKNEFNRDMDEIGQAFKDLTVKNK